MLVELRLLICDTVRFSSVNGLHECDDAMEAKNNRDNEQSSFSIVSRLD
jgi:hypothetical protein